MPYTLQYDDRFKRVDESFMVIDKSKPVVPFPVINNDYNRVVYEWTALEYRRLVSCVRLAADLLYPDDAGTIWWSLLRGFHQPIPEFDGEQDKCYEYPSYAPFITYSPTSPFVDNGFSLTYPVAPFFLWSHIDTWLPNWIDDWFFGAIGNATGYQENDILISYLSQPLVQNPFNGFDYPEIQIKVNGEGSVRIHLLQVPAGGRAIISVDDPPDLTDLASAVFTSNDRIVELNRDFTSFPPETDVDSIEDIEITGAGIHTIYISFVPTIDFDNALFLQFGGGFRSVELCGFNQTGLIMGITDIRMNNCAFEFLLDGTWQAANGFDPDCFKGDTGLQGIQGVQGIQGLIGADGIQGIQGIQGLIGADGIQGVQGVAGVDGVDGADGANGADGGNGDLYPMNSDAVGTDKMCEIGGFIVSKLSSILDTIKADKDGFVFEPITLKNLADSHKSFDVQALYTLILAANADGSFAGSVVADNNILHEEIYCSGHNQASFIVAAVATNSYYSDLASCVMPSTWAEWVFIGALQEQFDCSAFSCGGAWCYIMDFATGNQFGTSTTIGIWNGDGYISNDSSGDSHLNVIVDMPSLPYISSVQVFYEISGGVFDQIHTISVYGGGNLSSLNGAIGVHTPVASIGINADGIVVSFLDSSVAPFCKITKLIINGTGTNPYPQNDC